MSRFQSKTRLSERILVTSALPYANGPIHIGHLAGAYLPADIFVRYHRLQGDDIIHICGTDEHGVPIILRAREEGVPPKELVDRYYEQIRNAFEGFGISFDHFSRTSLPIHHETAQDFFLRLHEAGALVSKASVQLYDGKLGMFLPDRYVKGTCPHCDSNDARGDQCENCGKWLTPMELIDPVSALTGEKPVKRETTHWYFKLNDFQSKLEEWLDGRTEWKDNVVNFCRQWFKEGLGERAVTRDLNWGVPVPIPETAPGREGEGAKEKVLYVWFEALLGYISSTKEWAGNAGKPEEWKAYWQDGETRLIHFIGKDNIVFHAIMFPAMLMAYGGYVLPDNVPANEFLNIEGRKISTSKRYAVWLHEYLREFDPDALRYALAVNLPETRDTDFSWQEFQKRNNSELADILGNFIHRTLAFTQRYFDGVVPAPSDFDDRDNAAVNAIRTAPDTAGNAFASFHLRDGVKAVIELARTANRYFHEKEPWVTRKTDPKTCATTLYLSIQLIRTLAILMSPVLPFSADKLWRMLALEGKLEEAGLKVRRGVWEGAGELAVPAGHRIGEPEILFTKIEDEAIDRQIAKLESIAQAALT